MVRLILGCGYLGLRVAEKWLEAGDQVFAISRSQQRKAILEREGLQVITADITDVGSLKTIAESLPPIETILFAVGFDRSKYDSIQAVYVNGLVNFLEHVQVSFGHFIYISSTGVFGPTDADEQGFVTEDSSANPIRPGGVACLEAENLLRKRLEDRLTILRLAGIYGPSRVPSLKFIQQQQWDKLNPTGFLNLIHVTDAAEIVSQVAALASNADAAVAGEMFLVSDGSAVQRKVYYEHLAWLLDFEIKWGQAEGLEADSSTETRRSVNKRVDSSKLRKSIPVELSFPSYREGIADLLPELVDQSDTRP